MNIDYSMISAMISAHERFLFTGIHQRNERVSFSIHRNEEIKSLKHFPRYHVLISDVLGFFSHFNSKIGSEQM